MRAVLVDSTVNEPNVAVAEIASPEPGPGQVVVKVAAAAVNPIDVFTTLPTTPAIFGITSVPDRIGLGWDLAGVISAVGTGVSDWQIGDRVAGLIDKIIVPIGAQLEETIIDAGAITRVPAGVDLVEAATVPLNASTAGQALDLLDLAPGESLLVTGAAGALGGYLLELGRARGLRLVALAGAGDADLVRTLGATDLVERGVEVAARVRQIVPGGVDGVVDAAMLVQDAHDALRDGGHFVAVNGGALPDSERGTHVSLVQVKAKQDQLAELLADLAAGRITARIADRLPLEDIELAHKRIGEGGLRGRLVLIP